MKPILLALAALVAAGAAPCLAESPPAPTPADPLSLPPPGPTAPAVDCGDRPDPPPGPRFWGGADYLYWWVRRDRTPPLVVTGSPTDAFPGAADQPGTQILFGGALDDSMFSGLRLDAGAWLDADGRVGIDVGGFALERRSARFSAAGDAIGQPVLGAPFVDAADGKPNVYLISQNVPNPLVNASITGAVSVAETTQLWGWEANGVVGVLRNGSTSVAALAGFRQLWLRESLTYATSSTDLTAAGVNSFLTTPVGHGFGVNTFDSFRTENLFNGGQVGARVEHRWDVFALEVVGKVALGWMREKVVIDGLTSTNAPLPVTTAPGGIYAQTSNIGSYTHDAFAVVPELNVNLAVQLCDHLRARVGYTFLYVSDVVRPGEQIDPRINTNLVPIDGAFGTPGGPNNPAFDRHKTSFWAQGVNLGFEFTF